MGSASYEVLAIVGEGGMAVVKLALARGDNDSKRLVVLKHLRPVLGDSNDIRQMFLDEGRLAVRFNHPNIVHTYEVTKIDDTDAIVMEYLEGQPLTALLRHMKDGPEAVPLELLLRVLLETLRGLQYAHELADLDGTPLDLVHRDISPPNVFITYDGRVKILDFGIAKSTDSRNHTTTGVIKGKVTYMAPEQMVPGKVDARADIFAVGVMLWEMLARRRLWGDLRETEIMERVSLGDIPRPEELAGEVPAELSRICMKALKPDPDDRWQSAAEMAGALEDYNLALTANTGARELGKFLEKHFSEHRARVKKAIETAVTASKHRPSEKLRRIDLSVGPVTGSSERDIVAREGDTAVASLEPTRTDGSVSRHSAARTKPPDPPAPAGRSNALLGVAVVAVVLAAVAITWRAGKTATDATTTPPPPPPASSVAVMVKLVATPASARIALDDRILPGNPIDTTLREGSEHRARADAPGYVPLETTFRAEKDRLVTLDLEPLAKPDASAALPTPSASASAPPKPSATVRLAAPPKKDCSSPYYLDADGVKRFKPECL